MLDQAVSHARSLGLQETRSIFVCVKVLPQLILQTPCMHVSPAGGVSKHFFFSYLSLFISCCVIYAKVKVQQVAPWFIRPLDVEV